MWSYRVKTPSDESLAAKWGADHTNEKRLMRLISACAALHYAGLFVLGEKHDR